MRRPLRPYRGTARVARNITGHREGAPYAPPPPSKLPPKPSWLKLGARVALLTRISDRCASGIVGAIYEIRPTEDGETWEVGCTLPPDGRSANRRYRLNEIALWQEAASPDNAAILPDD
jgi:hypothetical protein